MVRQTEQKWKLEPKHRHYAQFLGLMGVLECEYLDFVIYTIKGIAVIPVHFHQPFYNHLFLKLSYFYKNYYFLLSLTLCVSPLIIFHYCSRQWRKAIGARAPQIFLCK